jgi:hypothetical protein
MTGTGGIGLASAANTAATTTAAKISIAVDAGLGAVIWVLFIITLIITGQTTS